MSHTTLTYTRNAAPCPTSIGRGAEGGLHGGRNCTKITPPHVVKGIIQNISAKALSSGFKARLHSPTVGVRTRLVACSHGDSFRVSPGSQGGPL